jgi:hypothetical protein
MYEKVGGGIDYKLPREEPTSAVNYEGYKTRRNKSVLHPERTSVVYGCFSSTALHGPPGQFVDNFRRATQCFDGTFQSGQSARRPEMPANILLRLYCKVIIYMSNLGRCLSVGLTFQTRRDGHTALAHGLKITTGPTAIMTPHACL